MMEPLHYFEKILPSWKAVDFLDDIRFILWVVGLREACDVSKHGRHLGRHLRFHQELEIRLKRQELVIVVLFM